MKNNLINQSACNNIKMYVNKITSIGSNISKTFLFVFRKYLFSKKFTTEIWTKISSNINFHILSYLQNRIMYDITSREDSF